MYLIHMLKKDLKRKKTMNIVLLIFITLAAMFIASSANNMITVTTAIDNYLEKADIGDHWVVISDEKETEKFYDFADKNGYTYSNIELIQIDPKDIEINGAAFDYTNTTNISTLKGSKVFDCSSEELTEIGDGEIYIPANIFNSDKNNFYVGATFTVDIDGDTKDFIIKGYVKDALFGSDMLSMTRFLVSENDFELFNNENSSFINSIMVYTDDPQFIEKFNALELNTIFYTDRSTAKMLYFMDTITSAIVLVVSLCLILISMVILHFTINFTMSEEFREIGVMKAIGIPNTGIRGLYIAKYFAVSIVGAAIGFALSIPFGNLLIENVSKNILISSEGNIALNAVCAIFTAAIVVAFCYFCTRKIKKFTPINAIRNGETGERYSKKSIISLSKAKLPVIPFMAFNDILSGIKKYASTLAIFTLGILLIIIPVNTINTIQSDKLIKWFSMADCDLVISHEEIMNSDKNNKEMAEETLHDVRNLLKESNIEAEVYQEITFKMNITCKNKKTSSMAFQGIGGVTADQYSYIKGTPPQNKNEVAISHKIAEMIGAQIGDDVQINLGNETRTYTVTAINQTMTNMGQGIRFYQDESLDYSYAIGSFGIQVKFTDNPDNKILEERMELLKKAYPDSKVYTPGEYVNFMVGDVAGKLKSVKNLILTVILCINMLVSVLMVKSFITKEKSEIAILKAIGFKNSSLTLWQTIRIGIILLFSAIIGTLLSTPLSQLIIGPVFRLLGTYSIEFEINKFEVYVFYPLIVLAVTSLSAFVSAQNLRKISASEASNIE